MSAVLSVVIVSLVSLFVVRFKRVEKVVIQNEKETSNELLKKLKFLRRYNMASTFFILAIIGPSLIMLIKLYGEHDFN